MGFWEIFLIVVCVCIVSGTVVAYVLRKKKGKHCSCDCCCSECSHCKNAKVRK